MTAAWEICGIGYTGAACAEVSALLKGTAHEPNTKTFSEHIMAQFRDLTSPFPVVDVARSQTFSVADAAASFDFSPGGTGISGPGHSRG